MTTGYAVQSYSGTDTEVVFTTTGLSGGTPIRYANIEVTNTGTTGLVYASVLTTSPAAGTDYTEVIDVGESRTLANSDPYWTQASSVIQKGTLVGGTAWTPAEVQPYGTSLAGQLTSPGTTVYLSGTGSWSVEGTD